MANKKKIDVAIQLCEECGGYAGANFCANCQSPVDEYNRCDECKRFVKTTPCPECFGEGAQSEFRVGDKCSLFVNRHSNKEIKDHVGFKGEKYKTYSVKIIEIIGNTEVKISVKGKEINISTDDLM